MDWLKSMQERAVSRIIVDEDGKKHLSWDLGQYDNIYEAAYEIRETILCLAGDRVAGCSLEGRFDGSLLTEKTDLRDGMEFDFRPYYVDFIYVFDDIGGIDGPISVELWEQDSPEEGYVKKFATRIYLNMFHGDYRDEWAHELANVHHFYNEMLFKRSKRLY